MSKRVAVVSALVEGNSLRSTCRMTGVAMNTVLKLLADLGTACAAFHDEYVRDIRSQRVQVDEIWSYCYSKARNVPEDKKGEFGYGDVWTWTAMDADTKLMVSYAVAERRPHFAYELMKDLRSRIANHRVQITTDGAYWYADAVDFAFGADADHATVVKRYGANPDGAASGRYSPAKLSGVVKEVIRGNPDESHISTSYVERQNLTMRMSMRRFTRLTNAFSKKVQNHAHAVAIHFAHYNFCRVHQTLRVTPAMEALLSDHVWSIEELVELMDRRNAVAA
jgi:IS1 family transposase